MIQSQLLKIAKYYIDEYFQIKPNDSLGALSYIETMHYLDLKNFGQQCFEIKT